MKMNNNQTLKMDYQAAYLIIKKIWLHVTCPHKHTHYIRTFHKMNRNFPIRRYWQRIMCRQMWQGQSTVDETCRCGYLVPFRCCDGCHPTILLSIFPIYSCLNKVVTCVWCIKSHKFNYVIRCINNK